MRVVLHAATAAETEAIGAALAPTLRRRDVVMLTGELGAGKTTLVRGLAAGVGATEHVASPTFTLVREYVTGSLPIAHVDVYRLMRMQDVVDLALDELVDGEAVVVIEWGDAVEALLPPDRLRIELAAIDPTGGREDRSLEVDAIGPSWDARAGLLEEALGPWGLRR